MSYSSTAKADLYEQVTQSIMRAIEEGAGQYVTPWHSLARPVNAISRKSYRGINTLLLCAAAREAQYQSNEWATYRQWQELGGQVRKGVKSTVVVFWKFFDRSEETEDGDGEGSEATGKRARCNSLASQLPAPPSGGDYGCNHCKNGNDDETAAPATSSAPDGAIHPSDHPHLRLVLIT